MLSSLGAAGIVVIANFVSLIYLLKEFLLAILFAIYFILSYLYLLDLVVVSSLLLFFWENEDKDYND